MSETGCIYSLNCPITGEPKYIGKTVSDLSVRMNNHLCQIHTSTKKNNWIKSLKSKGLKPTMETIDSVDIKEINFWEKYYISLYRSWGFDLKNHTMGGDGGAQSIESTKKISDKLKIYFTTHEHHFLGKKHTAESRAKMSASRLGKPNIKLKKVSAEGRGRMSASKKGQIAWNKGLLGLGKGRVTSDEVKEKISSAQRGRKMPPELREKIKHTFFKKGNAAFWKGKKMPPELVARMKLARAESLIRKKENS